MKKDNNPLEIKAGRFIKLILRAFGLSLFYWLVFFYFLINEGSMKTFRYMGF